LNVILRQPLFGYSSNTAVNFLLIGLVGHVGGWLCINHAQGHLPASLVSISVLGQPVVTAVLAVLIFHDRFSVLQILGGLAVLIGIAWVHHIHLQRHSG
jgi:drug/metabolite transporter (DMT)-like permease